MKLQLSLKGSAEPFINYLKSYQRIRESLLLEIDTERKAFVAKTFTEDKSAIRFASLSFEDAKMIVVEDPDEANRNGARINVGIFIKLKQFINIISRVADDKDSEGNSVFDVVINYDALVDQKNPNNVEFVASDISFVSSILKMRMNGFRTADLKYLPDDVFLSDVFNVNDPVTIEISPNTVNSIQKTSEIVSMDPRKDSMVFYNEGNVLFVKDGGNGIDKEPNFVYRVGELSADPGYPVSIELRREKFIKMFDKNTETMKVIIGQRDEDGKNVVDRLLFDSTESTTKIVIAGVRDH